MASAVRGAGITRGTMKRGRDGSSRGHSRCHVRSAVADGLDGAAVEDLGIEQSELFMDFGRSQARVPPC
jgi:hypothetical protein